MFLRQTPEARVSKTSNCFIYVFYECCKLISILGNKFYCKYNYVVLYNLNADWLSMAQVDSSGFAYLYLVPVITVQLN